MFINDNDIEKIKKNQKDNPNNKKEISKKKDISLDKKNVNLNSVFQNQVKEENENVKVEIKEVPKEENEYAITSDDDFTYQEDKRNIVEKLDYIAQKNENHHPFKTLFNVLKTLAFIAIIGLIIYFVLAYTKNNVDVPFTSIGIVNGKEYQLHSLVYTEDKVEYTVNETNVISLDEETGVIKGFNVGETTIKVKVGRDTEKIKVYIVEEEVKIERFDIDKNIVVNVGKNTIIPITCTPSNTTQLNFKYSSRDNNIASVSENGVITGVSAGSTTITITNNNISRSINVIVK